MIILYILFYLFLVFSWLSVQICLILDESHAVIKCVISINLKISWLKSARYRHKQKISLVMSNLNTNTYTFNYRNPIKLKKMLKKSK